MQISPGQIVRVNCLSVASISYPHDGIVSRSGKSPADFRVIHFCRADPKQGFDDGARSAAKDELAVRETSLEWFVAMGSAPHVVANARSPSPFTPEEVVRRARAQLGAAKYRLHRRNCQSFATHCYYGEVYSEAVATAGYCIAAALLAVAAAVVYATNRFASTPWAE